MILHDLTASGDRRFSPYCWRAKLALAHKGLDYEARPLSFTEIDGLNPDGPRLTFPTPDDGDVSVADRWAIAEYLEANHPDAPPLFPTGNAHTPPTHRLGASDAPSVTRPGLSERMSTTCWIRRIKPISGQTAKPASASPWKP